MKYTVQRIDEDIDFGCEERAADAPVMVVVTLTDEKDKELRIRQQDQMLYDRNINEGNVVILNEKNELQKPLDEDWTKHCTVKTVDTSKVFEMMQAVKDGKTVDWRCPFCGGKVGLIDQKNGYTVIGCNTCDMRINLDENRMVRLCRDI